MKTESEKVEEEKLQREEQRSRQWKRRERRRAERENAGSVHCKWIEACSEPGLARFHRKSSTALDRLNSFMTLADRNTTALRKNNK